MFLEAEVLIVIAPTCEGKLPASVLLAGKHILAAQVQLPGEVVGIKRVDSFLYHNAGEGGFRVRYDRNFGS